jgi:rhamnosyltransferase
LIDHKLGRKRWVPIISSILGRAIDYEPPWRYYYIVRNSKVLLREGLMDPAFYVRQLLYFGVRVLLADDFAKALGVPHGLMGRVYGSRIGEME